MDSDKVQLIDWMGSDLSVVRGARISNGAALPDWRGASDERLISFLAKHHHTSPFEHCTASFYVKAPIFVLREWMRHRTLSYNEMSARYKELKEEFWYPEKMRIQDPDNKQSSVEINHDGKTTAMRYRMRVAYETAWEEYSAMLSLGVAREVARAVLPVGIYSEMIVTGNLLNWVKFYALRSSPEAQQEIREYAKEIGGQLSERFPLSFAALTGTA